jgi:hypothetical protein
MKLDDPVKVLTWLRQKPSQEELRTAFPALWEYMEKELAAAIADRDPARLHRLLNAPGAPLGAGRKTTLGARDKRMLVEAALTQRMAALAIERYSMAVVTGPVSGKLRFNLFNGMLAQWLFFARRLERKPVSTFWFRLVWPLLSQKRFLMPLVGRKGIYCFYSDELIAELSALIGGRDTLEIGAGDGTLARFLTDCGVSVTAVDDYTWGDKISYPASVLQMDAQTALRHFNPEVVLCSWPPSLNDFEREVFQTPSVQLYIVILSAHRFASGNWTDYQTQQKFDLERRADLRKLVLPPELGTEVLVFRRRDPTFAPPRTA